MNKVIRFPEFFEIIATNDSDIPIRFAINADCSDGDTLELTPKRLADLVDFLIEVQNA